MSFNAGPQPLVPDGLENNPKAIDLRTIGYVDEVTGSMKRSMLLQWYTVIACSFIFFLCFVTGESSIILAPFVQQSGVESFCLPRCRDLEVLSPST